MKHPNNPYDRADSYRVAVAVRNKHGNGIDELDGANDGCQLQSIPTSNIFARIVYWFINLGNRNTDPEDLELLKKDFEIDEHKLTMDEFLMKFGTDPKKGFTQNKALDVLSHEGPNNILIDKNYSLFDGNRDGNNTFLCYPMNFIKRSINHTLNGQGIILWLMVTLAFLVYGLDVYFFYRFTSQYLFIAITLTLLNFTNGSMIYLQKKRLAATLKPSFKKILPKQCTVLRGGTKVEVLSEEVVVGDIVEVNPGNLIPADLRLIECHDCLKVDPFNLIGNHELQIKHYAFNANDPLISPNMLYASTKVIEGVGRGVVIATGNKTVIGRIITLAEKMIKIEVPLSEEIRDLMCFKLPVYNVLLSFVVLVTAVCFMQFTWLDGLAAVLAISIAFVPESFYITLTTSMVLNKKFSRINPKDAFGKQLRNFFEPRKGGLIDVNYENLESVETMGALTTLLIDETSLFVDEKSYKIPYIWYDANVWATDPGSTYSTFSGKPAPDGFSVHSRNETWHMLSRVALCCNSQVSRSRKPLQELYKDSPCDLTILNYIESIQSNSSKVREIYRKIADIPTKNPKALQMTIHLYENNMGGGGTSTYPTYSSSNAYHGPGTDRNWRHYAFIRGHPLYVIQRCTSVCLEGRETLLTDAIRRSYVEAYELMTDHLQHLNDGRNSANDSKYVIAFAEARLSNGKFPRDFDFLQYFSHAALNHQNIYQQSSKGSSFNYGIAPINIHSTLNSYNNLSTDGAFDESAGYVETDSESYLFEDMDFKLVGMIGLRAPAKYSVSQTRSLIHKFKNAGIKVIMLTSQPKEAAKNIAKTYGIFDENSETVEDIAEKLNVTLDKIDPSEANCHIIDCDDLKNMSYSEIDNTISSFLYDHYSTSGTLTMNKTTSLATILDSSDHHGPGFGGSSNSGGGQFPSNFQILFCNTNYNKQTRNIHQSSSTVNQLVAGTSPNFPAFSSSPATSITESQNKLRLIESFQRLGDVIAVTGKTTSDCIPLKRCDIGISLSVGNDVAKHAADICLSEDNFSSILDLVLQGRVFYDNLKKSLSYIMASNMCQMVAILVYVLLNIPLPLGIITILCIDLVTDLMTSIALFNERAEGNVLKRRPRDIYSDKLADIKLFKKSCLFVGIVQVFAGFLVYFIIMAENGFRPQTLLGNRIYWHSDAINDLEDSYGQNWSYRQRKNLEYACHSGFFLTIVLIQIINALLVRHKYRSVFKGGSKNMNVVLLGAIILEIIVAFLFIYVPGLNGLLGFYPIKIWWILPAFPFALFLFVYDEFRKFLVRRDPDSPIARETLY